MTEMAHIYTYNGKRNQQRKYIGIKRVKNKINKNKRKTIFNMVEVRER